MKIVLRLSRNYTIFVHLAYWQSETNQNISRLIGNHFCTSCENLVRFGLLLLLLLVSPRDVAKEVVRPESVIVTTVSSPMFAMGWG